MSRIFCIGMNYRLHVKELGDALPERPVVFMKPFSSLVGEDSLLVPPRHGNEFHYEAELVLRIGRDGVPQTDEEALAFIDGISLGLDLTLRDVQRDVRGAALPWEISKAFDGSAPVGTFSPVKDPDFPNGLTFDCAVNGRPRQHGDTRDFIFPCQTVLRYISGIWRLRKGDLVFTGTPAGVGALEKGDVVTLSAPWSPSFTWKVG